MKTKTIKQESKRLSVAYWKIGKEFGVSEHTILRWLRPEEIDDEKGTQLLNVIKKIGGEEND